LRIDSVVFIRCKIIATREASEGAFVGVVVDDDRFLEEINNILISLLV
jgi:hypothetical protein